jgi:hypothetical protein
VFSDVILPPLPAEWGAVASVCQTLLDQLDAAAGSAAGLTKI